MTAFTGEYKLRLPYTLLAVSSRIFSLSENQETVTCHVYRDKVNYVSISTHVCAQCQKNLPLKMIHNKIMCKARHERSLVLPCCVRG